MRPFPSVLATLALCCGLALNTGTAAAQGPGSPGGLRLRYTFQPDCFRPSLNAPCESPRAAMRLDLGPQIAVWLEKADGSTFVADLMVTNLTAVRGIGNRPGFWRFPSTWRFPYGKRKMVLPVWAHRRGRLYDTVVMQEDGGSSGGEMGIGFHESISSPDPYHCLTFMSSQWVFNADTVDAITCPTGVFNSSKGRLDSSEKSRYPPRSDLVDFIDRDCDITWAQPGRCPDTLKSATRFAEINDLDLVAAATPVYGKPYTGAWSMPADLPDGDYALFVEINKEFDSNASHAYKSYVDPLLPDAGFTNNFGQPAVVFRVPIRLDRSLAQEAVTSDIAGYADWDGDTGQLHAPDSTISDAPGSGRGRLLVIEQPALQGDQPRRGRVHVVTEVQKGTPRCRPVSLGAGEVSGLEVLRESVTATQATLKFVEPADGDKPVELYEIRYRQGATMTEEEFRGAVPVPTVPPSVPGTVRTFTLLGLKPTTRYVVGIRAMGGCLGMGPLALSNFVTPMLEFKQLSGCFIATAAYGSAQEQRLGSLRRLRDLASPRSFLAAAAVDTYERSSPPLAAVLRQSELARAVVRELLAPVVGALTGPGSPVPEDPR
jgi:hypothetical protein